MFSHLWWLFWDEEDWEGQAWPYGPVLHFEDVAVRGPSLSAPTLVGPFLSAPVLSAPALSTPEVV